MSRPQHKVKIEWSPNFAYAIGLLTTDGNLSSDGRHFDFTSRDRVQLENFMKALKIKVKITHKASGYNKRKITRIQFGDVNFYRFLLSLGLMPNKSKILGVLNIPNKYFFDFLRGHFDGDGTFYAYWDPRWRSSFMFYTVFVSASKKHIEWLRSQLLKFLDVKGHITKDSEKITYQLKYAKSESLKILQKMYSSRKSVCLSRKRLKIKKALTIIGKKLKINAQYSP